jgi:ADP-heptose:LPS heptosyltransferase
LEFVHEVANLPHIFNPRFYPTDEEHEKALKTKSIVNAGGPVIGWCLAGSRLDKVYPYSAMAVARLIKELGATVLLLGAPGKQLSDAQAICDHVVRTNGSGHNVHIAIAADYDLSSEEDRVRLGLKPGIINWPLRRVLSQSQVCDLMIGPDTGPMWAVAMEEVPKIMLLSHASETNITKHWHNTTTLHADQQRVPCWPCHQLHDTQDTCTPNKDKNGAACISDITVESILKVAEAYLQQEPLT